MEGKEAPKKTKGPIVDPALCRGCRSIKKCRLLTAEYEWMGNKEVYSDMIMDVFGLLLSHLDGDEKESCICATCVLRLREASAFRNQVLKSEEMFLEVKLVDHEDCVSETEFINKMFLSEYMALMLLLLNCPDSDHIMNIEVKAENLQGDESDNADCEIQEIPTLEQPENDTLANHVAEVDNLEQGKALNDDGLQQVLEAKVNSLQDKLEQMLEKPVRKSKESHRNTKKKRTIDRDNMAYANAVIIVKNSYVCPFHNRISNYYCYYCKDQFTNPNELREHTVQHDPVTLFEDTVENKKIPKIDVTRIDCRLCDEKIDDLNEFKSHITNAHGIKMHPVTNEFLKFKLTADSLTCTECSNTFPYFDSLKKHMIEHFGTLVCDICGACFLERNSLRTHINSHSKVEANFPCEICGKNLKSKYSRYLHVVTVHEKKPTVNCYKCDASFLSYALRNRHLIEVHGDKRTFPCKLCDKVYNRRKTLMEHNRRNHLKVMRHECNFCDQRFYLPSRLKEHMATHTGERNFRCNVCNKSYPRLQSLQDHVRIHGNEKKFKCHLCVSAFSQHSMYKSHLKNHHVGYVSNANVT